MLAVRDLIKVREEVVIEDVIVQLVVVVELNREPLKEVLQKVHYYCLLRQGLLDVLGHITADLIDLQALLLILVVD